MHYIKLIESNLKQFYTSVDDFFLRFISNEFFNNLIIAIIFPFFLFVIHAFSELDRTYTWCFLFFLTLVRCGYFLIYLLEKIADTYVLDKSYNWFLLRHSYVVFLIILSFTADNYLLFYLNESNFKEVPNGDFMLHAFDFFHYSFMTLTTVGLGEISANTRIAKLFSISEVFVGFVFVAHILSRFHSVRDWLINDKPLNRNYEEEKEKHNRNQ